MMSSPEVPRELAEPRGEPAPALGSGRSKVLAGEADSVPVAQRLAEDADLAMSLAALSRLSSGRLGLEDLLTEVAAGAVRAIPGAEGAGLTLLETDRGDTIVKTAPFVREVDDIQYGLGEGPCISAADTGRTVRSGSLGVDRRWPRFGARVGGLGVHSVLSLPLRTVDGVVGAMNVYAHPRDVFDERAERLGELFAAPAAIAVQNAQILAQARRLAEGLQAALANHAVIDQAVGIQMARSGITAEQALQRLRVTSGREHRKMAAVAADVVQAAVRRARAKGRRPAP